MKIKRERERQEDSARGRESRGREIGREEREGYRGRYRASERVSCGGRVRKRRGWESERDRKRTRERVGREGEIL